MQPLSREELWNLADYARQRPSFRQQVMAHKQPRRVAIGPHAVLYFEDRLTIQYQIQEMLRAEEIAEPAAIEEELSAYNPLIPQHNSLSATFMLEYTDPEVRKARLAQLVGIEYLVWAQITPFDRVFANADEDLLRSTEDKTSAVHFLRFTFSDDMVRHFLREPQLALGIDHPAYSHSLDNLPEATLSSLAADFEER
jgi:hypothetical protein